MCIPIAKSIWQTVKYAWNSALNFGRIVRLDVPGDEGRRLAELGAVPGTEVRVTRRAPLGDPIEVTLRGYELTLRLEDASKIEIEEMRACIAQIEERFTGFCEFFETLRGNDYFVKLADMMKFE